MGPPFRSMYRQGAHRRVAATLCAILLFSTSFVPAVLTFAFNPFSAVIAGAAVSVEATPVVGGQGHDDAAGSAADAAAGTGADGTASDDRDVAADATEAISEDGHILPETNYDLETLCASEPEVVERRIVAWPRAGVTPEEIEDIVMCASYCLELADDTVIVSNPYDADSDTLVIIESDPAYTECLMAEMIDSGLFEVVDFDVLVDPLNFTASPNDPLFCNNPSTASSWALHPFPGANFAAVWPRLHLARGTAQTAPIAVIDSGFDMGIDDRGANIVAGFDFGSNRTEVTPQSTVSAARHGTAVAGVIGAATNNRRGKAGAAWDNRVIIYKATDARENLYLSAVANSIKDVVDRRNARIINLSLGGTVFPTFLRQAVDSAKDSGILVIAAAGNTAQLGNQALYPAAYERVLSVGALGTSGQWARFSTHNSGVNIAAPGEQITTLNLRSGVSFSSGTSFATPYVSAAAALVWRADPTLTAPQVKDILLRTARPIGARGNPQTGAGALNAAAAFEAALQAPVQPRNITVRPGQNSVQVSWTRGANCPLPLTGYVLQWRVRTQNTWNNVQVRSVANSASHTVRGLQDNLDYVFRVAAVNRNGMGNFSSSIASRPYQYEVLISRSSIRIRQGRTATIRVAPHYCVRANLRIQWRSSNPRIATITNTGKTAQRRGNGSWTARALTDRRVNAGGKQIRISALRKGTTQITFTVHYAQKSIRVTVH